ncbi:MAG: flippase-like domain-containing protein [Acidobacteriota bacterium]|nr:flippase-like domain-containing protein [Acidobacteriota bacterium]
MGEKKSRSVRSRILLVVINLASLGSLLWALRGAHLGELKEDLAEMSWWWVALAVAADVSVYLWHGVRWQTLLRPVVKLKYWEPVRAIYVGLFANEVLPFRAGEVLRCYLLARNPLLPLSVSLTSALIERVFDGIWLSLCIIAMLRYTRFPHSMRYLVDGAYVLGITVLVLALVLGVVMFRRHETRAALAGEKGWRRQLHVLIDDLEIMGHSRTLLTSFVQSLPYLMIQLIPIYAALRAYGFDLSLGVAFVLMVVLRLSTVVPQAPGNLGLFQVVVRETLAKVFNVVPAEAARFSLVLWGIMTIPLLIGGAISLAVTESKLSELQEAAKAESSQITNSRP